jgi:hypothetical protein
MNEIEWLSGADPAGMLNHIGEQASDRKLRLFACACARRFWRLLRYPRPREAIEIAERFAEGRASSTHMEQARQQADLSAMTAPQFEVYAYMSAAATVADLPLEAAQNARENARLMAVREASQEVAPWEDEVRINAEASAAECRAQCELVRELFGNPFRPVVLKRLWLDWSNGAVSSMARVIFDGEQFDELPYLADALLDAGCDDENLLRHLRNPAGHVRGCWALDALLGLE